MVGIVLPNVLVGLPIIRGIRSTVWVTHDTDFSVKACSWWACGCFRSLVSAKCGSRTHFWCYIDTQWDLVTPRCDPGRWLTISVDNGHVSGFLDHLRVMGMTTFHVQMDMYSTLIRATVARMDVDTCMELWVSDMDRLDHVWSH